MLSNPLVLGFLLLVGLALVLQFAFQQRFDAAVIKEVLDGDSLIVTTSKYKRGVKVRLAGVDAPEKSSNMLQASEKFAELPTRFVKERYQPGTKIFLEYDTQKWDQYGRLLAYVYSSKRGKSLNEELLRRGYAYFKPHKRNKKYARHFQQLESQARAHKYGLWKHHIN